MNKVLKEIYTGAVMPVVTLENRESALRLAEAFIKGHMLNIEIVMRNDKAAECIEAIHQEFPEMALGAGTVLRVDQLNVAYQAGARFIVSPGYDDEIVDQCQKLELPVIPGAVTSTEIIRGIKAGLSVFKYFPAEPLGGLAAIKYLAAPFKGIWFLPAGGIGMGNLSEYLGYPAVFACAGGFMARDEQIRNQEWNVITSICEQIHVHAVERIARYPYPF